MPISLRQGFAEEAAKCECKLYGAYNLIASRIPGVSLHISPAASLGMLSTALFNSTTSVSATKLHSQRLLCLTPVPYPKFPLPMTSAPFRQPGYDGVWWVAVDVRAQLERLELDLLCLARFRRVLSHSDRRLRSARRRSVMLRNAGSGGAARLLR